MAKDNPTFDELAVNWLMLCEYCKGYPDAKECECDNNKEANDDCPIGN